MLGVYALFHTRKLAGVLTHPPLIANHTARESQGVSLTYPTHRLSPAPTLGDGVRTTQVSG